MLAAMGQVLDLPRSRPPSQWQTELRELHTARLALAKDRTATQNRQKQACLPLVKRQCASRLRHIERQLKALEAEMLKHIKSDSAQARALEILTSIPGIGAITAVAVLAEMPEIGSLGVAPFQWTVYGLGVMQLPDRTSRSRSETGNPGLGDGGEDYTNPRYT